MSHLFQIVCLVMVLACPLWAGEPSGAAEGQAPAEHCMQQDSGLTWYQVAGLLAAIGGSTALGWQGCKKMNAIRIEPQPLEVKSIAECATRKELEDFKADVREDFRRVHQRIDNSVEDIAEIKGEMKRIAINQEKILDILLRRHDQQ